jgi:hypothetical protein
MNKEDIEQLGFIMNENSGIFHKGKYSVHANGSIINHTNQFMVFKDDDLLFKGTVKNVSELKVLLKQLGIE